MSQKLSTLIHASLLSVGAMINPGVSSASGSVIFGDPKPNVPPTDCNGISYEWTVTIGKPSSASFVHTVGAKSWNEPPPFYTPPETGWTHTSNFVALELQKDATVTIQVARQQGSLMSTIDSSSGSPALAYTPVGSQLYPAFSLWKGWNDDACEFTAHRYNNAGPISWAPNLEYIANQPNAAGAGKATLTLPLSAGKYTLAIGGANLSFCSTAAACYTGLHAYRAVIKTQ